MSYQFEELPKVPPFISPTPPQSNDNHNNRSNHVSDNNHVSAPETDALRVTTLIISLVSLALALTSGAVLAFTVLVSAPDNKYDGIWSKLLVIGLTYAVGWIVGLYCIRGLNNLILPILIQIYMWLTLVGVCALYIAIMVKLFNQGWNNTSFLKYSLVMFIGLMALVGLHLMLDNHSLVPFAIPLLLISLVHLYFIVFHYVFFPAGAVDYSKLWGDIVFFLGMGLVSILMLAHMGLLNPTRQRISQMFSDENYA